MITEIIHSLGNVNRGLDSDFSDRLNFRYTNALLIGLGILVTTRQFVGEAIICWSPQQFTGQWITYADNYCWISNTRFFYDNNMQTHTPSVGGHMVEYYQWTPLILFLMSLLFTMPHLLWKSVYDNAGFNFEEITVMATSFETMVDSEQWQSVISKITRHIDRYLELQKQPEPSFCGKVRAFLTGKCVVDVSRHNGNYLTIMYPMVKCCFLLNILFQYYCLTCWIGQSYSFYGLTVITDVFYKGMRFGDVIYLFPRVTWCTVRGRAIEEVHGYHMHCVLPINIFNEYVFLFIWYWLLLLFIVSSVSIIRWFANCTTVGGHDYIRKHLKFCGRLNSTAEKKLMKRFLRGYLKSDGIFIIKMLSKNTTSLFISDLTQNLFDFYIEKSKGINMGSHDDNAKQSTPAASAPHGYLSDSSQPQKCGDCFALTPIDRETPPALPPKIMTMKPIRDIPSPRNYIPVPSPPPHPDSIGFQKDIGCSGLTLGRDSEQGTMMLQRRITSSQELTISEQVKPPGTNFTARERSTDDSMMNIMPPNYSMSASCAKGP